MARNHQTSDEAHAQAAASGSHRIAIGAASSDYAMTAMPALTGTPVPRKNTQSADPTAGGKANRTNIEKLGATYRVNAKADFYQLDPSAGPTMMSARIVPSVAGRGEVNFESGIQTSY
jgi:hypothetical protein